MPHRHFYTLFAAYYLYFVDLRTTSGYQKLTISFQREYRDVPVVQGTWNNGKVHGAYR